MVKKVPLPDPFAARRGHLEEALAHKAAGRHEAAVAAFRRHLVRWPTDAGTWADLGGELGNLGRFPEAIAACQHALALAPALPAALVSLGLAQARQGAFDAAEPPLRQALDLQPEDIYARLALVECLLVARRMEEAIGQLEVVLERDPGNSMAFKRLADIHHRTGNREGLVRTLDRWIAVDPDCPERVWERGALRLMEGRFVEGWADLEARFSRKDQVSSLLEPFREPRWDGSPFPGRTLLLHWEQGLGDTLMFIRFARRAKARGGRVVALVQPPLRDLVATCEGLDEVLAHGEPLPSFDLQLPLMSLPHILQLGAADIPVAVPYLRVPDRVPNRDVLNEILSLPTERVRIGYVWAGNAGNLNDGTRTIPPACLAPLEALPGVAWHCFQLPPPETMPLRSVPLGPLLSNFSDTAYALGFMDLVLTADTAMAHLAGAMGLPTFLMLRFDSEWRWMLGRDDSPWYPTMRIYRQPAPGDWDAVIQAICSDLMGG
jgi:tetratricopeptide (TPR) repeat protein